MQRSKMDAVMLTVIGAALLGVGVLAVVVGILPVDEAIAVGERVWPILLFVVAATVVADIAARAGVFDVTAAWLARLSRGRTVVLWLLIVALATVSTAFLSLDTTAVLLTPVVISCARANGLPALPFVFTTVWLANTASLFLPVSNLTNLLAEHRLGGVGPGGFLALIGPSAVVAALVTTALLWFWHRREVRGRFVPAAPPVVSDRRQLLVVGSVVVILLPLLVSGLPPWIPTLGAAAVLVGYMLYRSPRILHIRMIPWSLVVFASGLFLAVSALLAWTGDDAVRTLVGSGDDLVDLWRVAGAGLIGANAIDNLPAYLLLEPVADSPARLAALLIGVGAGPLITPWASLATLLWHQRLVAAGVEVSWRTYMARGAIAAPVVVGLAVVPLAFPLAFA